MSEAVTTRQKTIQIQSFDWSSLPRLTRREADVVRAARAALATTLSLDELSSALTKLVQAPVELSVTRLGLTPTVPPHTVDVWVTADGDRSRSYVALEPGLVAVLLGAMLGRPATAHRPHHPPVAELVGGGSALLIALLRRITPHPWRLSPSRALPDALWIEATALVGEQVYGLWIAAPLASIHAVPRPFERRDLAGLGHVPLTLPLVGAVSALSLADLALLEPGAAFLPSGGWLLEVALPPRGAIGASRTIGLSGPCVLAAPHGESGIPMRLTAAPSGVGTAAASTPAWALVVTAGDHLLPWSVEAEIAPRTTEPTRERSSEAPMNPSSPPASSRNVHDNPTADLAARDPVASALEAAPVVMRLELGSVTLTAAEWARLAPGDVIGTGIRVGEAVVLRVGGAEFGRGELCEVEGELAVRLLSRGDQSR
jgi:flagellar motor switch/type III secretory pathway protein FliN